MAAGSPWMTDPVVYMTGDPNQPPLSLVPAKARDEIVKNGRHLFQGLTLGRGMSEPQAKEFIAQHSIEANADKIVISSLFITSRGDEQAPHVLIEPMINRMKAAGKDVTVYTAEKSPHGFYWARTVSAARALRGEKSPEELAEEMAAREQIMAFFKRQFARTDVGVVASPKVAPAAPEPGKLTDENTKAPSEAKPAAFESKPDTRITPTASQSTAIKKLREKIANMPVPENLQRRTILVGDKEREFFINIPAKCKGTPSPVVFALHGGATSSGLAEHMKVDFTKLGETEGYVTVYPSGVNGWNIGSHDTYSVKRRTSNADDIGFFRAMFDTLIKEGIADPKHIYITGSSNGGVMTQNLICHLADYIAGAGVVVATLPRAAEKDWPKPARVVPILLMLGTVDTMKPWKGNRDQMSADESIAFWRKQNACTAEGKKWDLPDCDPHDGCPVRAQRWEGKAPVVFYTMEEHGHGWPMQRGRDETGTGPKTRDISAPEEFWAFWNGRAFRD